MIELSSSWSSLAHCLTWPLDSICTRSPTSSSPMAIWQCTRHMELLTNPHNQGLLFYSIMSLKEGNECRFEILYKCRVNLCTFSIGSLTHLHCLKLTSRRSSSCIISGREGRDDCDWMKRENKNKNIFERKH